MRNAANTAENAGLGITEYMSLCTHLKPLNLEIGPWLCLTLHTGNQFLFSALKANTGSRMCCPSQQLFVEQRRIFHVSPMELAIRQLFGNMLLWITLPLKQKHVQYARM